jgi:hypothetical protein
MAGFYVCYIHSPLYRFQRSVEHFRSGRVVHKFNERDADSAPMIIGIQFGTSVVGFWICAMTISAAFAVIASLIRFLVIAHNQHAMQLGKDVMLVLHQLPVPFLHVCDQSVRKSGASGLLYGKKNG